VSAHDAIRASALVEVDPATAFEVFTEEVDAWWKCGPAYRFRGAHDGVMRFEPGVGGRLVQVPDEHRGEEWEVGRIKVWEPGARLVFDFRIPVFGAGESTEVEVTFEPVAGGTRVTVEHRGWRGIPRGHPARHGLPDEAFLTQRGTWWIDQLRALRGMASDAG
jgi:uncharacterized protein YndB with AHSA1/START domain